MNRTQSRFRHRNSGPKSGRNQRKGRNSKPSVLDPESLIKKCNPTAERAEIIKRNFSELSVDDRLKERIRQKGYVSLTEIQDQTMEPLLSGHDVIGIANTGTGKTAAFLIPIIHKLLNSNEFFQTLILVPTRELALQVETEFRSLTAGLNLHCTCLIGGTNIHRDLQRLGKRNHIIVGTPGRTLDHIRRRALVLNSFTTLVLDEFDRMLDMGFINDVMQITAGMANRQQTILFSATENRRQRQIISELVKHAREVRISSVQNSTDHIDQDIVRISNGEDKFNRLLELLGQHDFGKVLVFAETKRGVIKLTVKLKKSGVIADEIHGDKSQAYRNKALSKFRQGAVRVLVATDVAARGIDVDDITHVINYQIPRDRDSYVHRIGRTGRAGKPGKAITLID